MIISELEKEKAESLLKLNHVEINLYRDEEDPVKMLTNYLSTKKIKVLGVEGNISYRIVKDEYERFNKII